MIFLFRALKYRNYRLFFFGQGISLIGTWMQQIALSWLVYRLTNSTLLLGIVGFAGQFPVFLLALFTGVLADRVPRRNILLITQILSMIQAFILAFLTLSGFIKVWHIISMASFLGIINAFDMPTRQSFVVDMVDQKKDFGNAIALNSSMFNGARLIGPSIGGILIATIGEGFCFLVNAITYMAVIVSLIAMKLKYKSEKIRYSHIIQQVKEGFSYTFGFPPIKFIILLLGLVSLVGMPYVILMPVLAKEVLHGGAHTLGFLMGATGVGALIGSLYLASRKNAIGLEKIIPLATIIFGSGLVVVSLSRTTLLSLILMLFTGFGMMVQMAASNTVLQTIVDDDKRGRVMSFFTMSFMGTMPFGSLLAGWLASKIGVQNTLMICGLACLSGAGLFACKLPQLQRLIQPGYRRTLTEEQSRSPATIVA